MWFLGSRKKKYHWRLGLSLFTLGLGLTIFGYVGMQQMVRLGANDWPAMIAAPTALRVSGGTDPASQVGPPVPGLGLGTYPSVIIYDHTGKAVATNISGYTDKPDSLPWKPPVGTFRYDASKSLDHRFTWQPQGGPRLAAVLAHFNAPNGYYVLAAQNLQEPERRIDTLGGLAAATIIGVAIVALLAAII